jgi:regulator of replication initiation timing
MEAEVSLIKDYWQQVMGLLALVTIAVKLSSSVKELRKDVDEIISRNTFLETTKLREQVDMQEKQISALWAYINKLRDMINGSLK